VPELERQTVEELYQRCLRRETRKLLNRRELNDCVMSPIARGGAQAFDQKMSTNEPLQAAVEAAAGLAAQAELEIQRGRAARDPPAGKARCHGADRASSRPRTPRSWRACDSIAAKRAAHDTTKASEPDAGVARRRARVRGGEQARVERSAHRRMTRAVKNNRRDAQSRISLFLGRVFFFPVSFFLFF